MKMNETQISEICALYQRGENGHAIAKQFGISPVSVYRVLRRRGIPIKSPSLAATQYVIDESLLELIDCEWKAYFLGLLYADGCIYKNVISLSLQERDKHILLTLVRFLFGDTYRGLYYRQPSDLFGKNGKIYKCKPQWALKIFNKKVASDLRLLGCVSRKSLILTFPSFEIVPENLMRHFIRGLFDGDGSIYKKNGGSYVFKILGSKLLIPDLAEFIRVYAGVGVSCYSRDSISVMQTGNRRDILKLFNFLYDDSDPFLCLERKLEKFRTMIVETNWEKIDKPKYSTLKGVTFDKRRGKWIASKKHRGITKFLGYFGSETEAHAAFLAYESCL